MDATRAVLVDHQQFAGLELPHEVGADRVEGRGLRRQHPAPVTERAQAQGPEPVRVADADEPMLIEDDQRKRPLQLRQ